MPANDAPVVARTYLDTLIRQIPDSSEPDEDEDEDEETLLIRWKDPSAQKDKEEVSLRNLRLFALKNARHAQTWSNNFVPAFLFRVGDIGYVPPSSAKDLEDDIKAKTPAYGGFHRFVRICNIFDDEDGDDDEDMEVEEDATGSSMSFDSGRFGRTELACFEAGESIYGFVQLPYLHTYF